MKPMTPFGRSGSANGDCIQFTGHEADRNGNQQGLIYAHARYLDMDRGRFLSVDPVLDIKEALHEPQMWNRYSYVTNNPLKFTDPDGRYRTWNEKPMTAENLNLDTAPPVIQGAFAIQGGLLTLGAGGPLRNLAFKGSLLLMRNPGTVLAAMKVLDSLGGNVSGHINPAGMTGGKLGYVLGNVASEKSVGKGGFFAGVMGFTAKTLDGAIRSHFADNFKNAVLQKDGRLAVTGAMTGANGVVTTVKTVWQWNKDNKVWDMITAVPAK